MNRVSVFTIEDLERDLVNLHNSGPLCLNNPHLFLAGRKLTAIIEELEKVPQQLQLTTGAHAAEGLSELRHQTLIPPRSVIGLEATFYELDLVDSTTPRLYAGWSHFLSLSAIAKTLANDGRLNMTLGV